MRWLKGCMFLLLGLAILVAACSVGFVPARELTVVAAEDGAPQREVLVVYHYESNRFNPVQTSYFRRPGGLVRSSMDGSLTIPGRWYLKHFSESYARPRLNLLYVPELHFARRLALELGPDLGDDTWKLQPDGQLRVRTLTDDPAAWERSLDELHTLCQRLRYLPANSPEIPPAEAAVLAPELEAALRREYTQLLDLHRATPRRSPPEDAFFVHLPPAEQAAIRAGIAKDLARLPTWGDYLLTIWSSRVE